MKRQILGLLLVVALPGAAAGQAPPPQAPPPPAAPPAAPAPSFRVGTTVFADYTFTDTPKTTDANGDQVNLSAFNLTRSYINLTGNVSARIAFRITPDIVRNTDAGSTSGSLLFRIKYAYAQMRAGDDTIIRLGIQPTPMIDGQEGVYRYRFQGTSFVEREAGLSSSDAGLTVLKPLPKGYGDVHVGFYNGEGYSRSEVNNQKALMMRATVKPLPTHSLGKGLRLIGYYHRDHYVKDAPRGRAIGSVMFEHSRFNVGVDYAQRVDQSTPASREITGRGYSFFVTPFFDQKGRGVEGLLRFDSFDPDVDVDGRRTRLIAGAAYWFPRQGTATAALLAHMEQVRLSGLTPTVTSERRYTLNLLITF